MIGSLLIGIIKNIPKLLCVLLTFINIVLVFFVYNGATHDSEAYSSLYLIEYQFSNTSNIYSIIASQYASQNDGASLSDFSLKVGYMGLCVEFGSSLDEEGSNGHICGYTSDIINQYNNNVPEFSLTSSNTTNSANLELFDIATAFQEKVMKRTIFIIMLICLLALIVTQLWLLFQFLPFQIYVTFGSIFILIFGFIVLCIMLIWGLVAESAVANTGNKTSLNILTVTYSKKPSSILWAVFALLLIEILYYCWELIRDRIQLFAKDNQSQTNTFEKDIRYNNNHLQSYKNGNGTNNNSVMSSISTLRSVL